jgi:hypothetical protein
MSEEQQFNSQLLRTQGRDQKHNQSQIGLSRNQGTNLEQLLQSLLIRKSPKDLKGLSKQIGLACTGNKPALVKRLTEYLATQEGQARARSIFDR